MLHSQDMWSLHFKRHVYFYLNGTKQSALHKGLSRYNCCSFECLFCLLAVDLSTAQTSVLQCNGNSHMDVYVQINCCGQCSHSCRRDGTKNDEATLKTPGVFAQALQRSVTIPPFLPRCCCWSPRRWRGSGSAAVCHPVCTDLLKSRSPARSGLCNQEEHKANVVDTETQTQSTFLSLVSMCRCECVCLLHMSDQCVRRLTAGSEAGGVGCTRTRSELKSCSS